MLTSNQSVAVGVAPGAPAKVVIYSHKLTTFAFKMDQVNIQKCARTLLQYLEQLSVDQISLLDISIPFLYYQRE